MLLKNRANLWTQNILYWPIYCDTMWTNVFPFFVILNFYFPFCRKLSRFIFCISVGLFAVIEESQSEQVGPVKLPLSENFTVKEEQSKAQAASFKKTQLETNKMELDQISQSKVQRNWFWLVQNPPTTRVQFNHVLIMLVRINQSQLVSDWSLSQENKAAESSLNQSDGQTQNIKQKVARCASFYEAPYPEYERRKLEVSYCTLTHEESLSQNSATKIHEWWRQVN